LGAQQIELPRDEDEGNKCSQATNAGTDPMDDFQPHGNGDMLLSGDEWGQHQANRKTEDYARCQNQ
jgi:hypothetical protein